MLYLNNYLFNKGIYNDEPVKKSFEVEKCSETLESLIESTDKNGEHY